MWAIRMLTGSHAGQVLPLKEGQNLIGRGGSCSIRFNDLDVSKEHAIIAVEGELLSIQDNQSRNGTFVNGVKISRSSLKRGDKVSFNQTMCDIVKMPAQKDRVPVPLNQQRMMPSQYPTPGGYPQSPQSHQGSFTPAPVNHGGYSGGSSSAQSSFFARYFEEVLMPGVFQLGKVMEFKLVIGLFMLIFAVAVTALSTIPMLAITSDSIQIESRRRALTIGRNLANVNQAALLKGMDSALSTQTAELEEGVSMALIVRSVDGSVMAPASKAGTIPSAAFIEKARREQKELVQQVDSSHIAIAVPLAEFNPETSVYSIKAFAVVVYDMGTLAVDDGRTLSLFFQTLLIALALGFILYYLFYRFVEYPISALNNQLDTALKDKVEAALTVDLDFPIFQNLISNVNTLLSRVSLSDGQNSGMVISKELEIINTVRMMGYAAIAMTAEQNIIGLNGYAEEFLNITEARLRNQPISLIPSQAVSKGLLTVMEAATREPNVTSKWSLDYQGKATEINCQAITDKGKVSFFIATLYSTEGG